MCGRYALHANPEVVALQFGLEAIPDFKARYNICPGTEILAVDNRRKARLVPWGGRFANARAETVGEKPAFRDAFRRFRCLVPASGFYEWQNIARTKRPWYVQPTDSALFGLAGFVSLWQGKRSVTLITTEPNPLMATIHDRMPVIVPHDAYARWLQPGEVDPASLADLFAPAPVDDWRGVEVSPHVNKPDNDDPQCIEPAAPSAQGSLF